jgi:hypothetical protein
VEPKQLIYQRRGSGAMLVLIDGDLVLADSAAIAGPSNEIIAEPGMQRWLESKGV